MCLIHCLSTTTTTSFLKFIGIIFYVFGYLSECEFDISGDLNYVENRFENVNYGDLCNCFGGGIYIKNTQQGFQEKRVALSVFFVLFFLVAFVLSACIFSNTTTLMLNINVA